ncbi:MAG: alkaline phosphatase family protein [Methanobacteriota archaeon]
MNHNLNLNKKVVILVFVGILLLLPVVYSATSNNQVKVGITAPSQIKPGDTLKLWISTTNFGEVLTQAQSQNISEQIKILGTLSEKNKVTINEIEVGNPFLTIAEDKKITALNKELISAGDALALKKQLQEELYQRHLKENLTLDEIKPYVEQEKLLNEIIEKGSTGAFVELPVPKEFPEGQITIPIKVSYSSEGSTNYVTAQVAVTVTSNPQPGRAVIFIVDAARADKMYDSASAGLAPSIKGLIDSGVKFTSAKTVFPSITPSGHSSILTGAYPARSGIPGMTWFNKNNFEYKDYNALYYKIKWEVNNDLLTQTIFEVLENYNSVKNTATILEFVRNGADDKQGLSIEMFGDYEWIKFYKILGNFEGIREWSKELDYDTMTEALYRFQYPQNYYSNGLPTDLMAIWLPGNDIISHEGGPDETYGAGSMSNIDAQVGRLLNEPTFQTIKEETVFIITADHGQTAVTSKVTKSTLESVLENAGYFTGVMVDPMDEFELPYHNTDAVVAPNGGMAQIYVQSGITLDDPYSGTWNSLPRRENVLPAADAFKNQPYISAILVRYQGSNGYEVYYGNPLSYPDAQERINGLNSDRSGDIILLANYDSKYYFGDEPEKGTHGHLNDKDTYVPLIFSGSGVKHDTLTSARTIDIAPTIVNLLLGTEMSGVDGRVLEEIKLPPPDTTPPTITNAYHSPSSPTSIDSINIYSDITDASGVSSATLFYSTDGFTWKPIPMTNVYGNTWKTSTPIPAQPAGTTLQYTVCARDAKVNYGCESGAYCQISGTQLSSGGEITAQANCDVAVHTVTIGYTDTAPPSIYNTYASPSSPSAYQSIEIYSEIKDDSSIASALVWYTTNGIDWNKITMTNIEGNKFKTVEPIPGQAT